MTLKRRLSRACEQQDELKPEACRSVAKAAGRRLLPVRVSPECVDQELSKADCQDSCYFLLVCRMSSDETHENTIGQTASSWCPRHDISHDVFVRCLMSLAYERFTDAKR